MNLDDKSLFLDAMEDVQPLKRATDVHWHPTRNQRAPQRIDTLQLDNFLTTGFLDIIPLTQPLEFRREGLQHGVLDKLRSGKYPATGEPESFAPAGGRVPQNGVQFHSTSPGGWFA